MTRLLFPLRENRLIASFALKTKSSRNVSALLAACSLFFSASADTAGAPNGRDLIERSLAAGERNELQLSPYVSRSRSDSKQFAPDGSVKSEEVKTFDDVEVDEFHVRKLVAKNDKPLTGADRQKEEARVAKLIAQRKRETPEAKQKRLADAEEKRDKDHRFSHELLDAFDYNVVGEETIDGRKCWVLDATPHPGYKPKELKAQIFPHLRGRLWIDQQDLLWVKADANAVDQFSVGFSMIAKLDQGARLVLEQSRLPDGTWIVRKTGLKASGRIAMVKHFSIENVTSSDNYRKVPANLKIVDGKEEF